MGYLLDTNVVSELTKARPDPGVVAWREQTAEADHFLSVLVLGEFRRGIEYLPHRDHDRASEFYQWLTTLIHEFGTGVILVTRKTSDFAGRWCRPESVHLVRS
jgi:predicted nucleic acid-binding protein